MRQRPTVSRRPAWLRRPAAAIGLGLALVVAAVAAPTDASAQGGPPSRVTLSPADVVFPPPTDMSFMAGWVDYGAVSVTVEPRGRRTNWQLFLQASAADMGGYGKPVQDILVRAQGSAAWTPLGTTQTLVAEGSGATTVTLYYRLLLDLSVDAPGVYSVPLEYSATSF